MRSLAVIAAIFFATLFTGCGLLPETKDETVGWSANKLYTEAKVAMDERAYDKAIKYFEKLESRYPYGRFAQQAQIDIAYAYWKDNEPASALAATDRFIKLHPNHPNVDYVYYLRGLISFNEDLGLLGNISQQDMTERDPKGARESFDAFRELVTRFPESKYTPDAILRMKYLVNALASLEVHVARYYMTRKAYLAAVNRAQSVVKEFSNTRYMEEALAVMVSGYTALNLPQLADDSRRVLAKTYPDSLYLKQDWQPAEMPWYQFWR